MSEEGIKDPKSLDFMIELAVNEYHRQLSRIDSLKTKVDLFLSLMGITFSYSLFKIKKADKLVDFLKDNITTFVAIILVGIALYQVITLVMSHKYVIVSLVKAYNNQYFDKPEKDLKLSMLKSYTKALNSNRNFLDKQFNKLNKSLFFWMGSIFVLTIGLIFF